VSCGGLRNLLIRGWLDSVDKVGELNCILDKKDRNIVPYDIKQTLVCIAV
jgi:hypothetical protein